MRDRRSALRAGAAWAAAGVVPAVARAAPERTVTVERPLDGAFTSVRLALPADFVLTPAATAGVRVTAAREIEPLVRVMRRGDELTVDAARSFQTRDPLRIEIRYRTLTRARVEGSGDVALEGPREGALELSVRGSADVQVAGLNLKSLRVDIEGSASVTAAGSATEQTVGLKGSATYDAEKLRSRRVTAEAQGSSEATVDAAERLVATVDGTASVRYRGSPRVERKVGGSGTVERI